MIKLGIFLDNAKLAGMDCQHIDKGNPGISGTAYMISLMSYMLSARDNGIDVTVLSPYEYTFHEVVKVEIVGDLCDAYDYCKEKKIDYLLFKHQEQYSAGERRMFQERGGVKLLVWCHNFVKYSLMRLYQKSSNVCRVISVGREQMDLYRDSEVFQKSDYIYNCIDLPSLTEHTFSPPPFSQRKNIVTYMGAVVPGKGVHILAKAWKDVLKEVPDAELYIIGNGILYGGSEDSLGKFKLAERKYEDMFSKYLTIDYLSPSPKNSHPSTNKTLHPSIHLMGVMGGEKFEILKQTKVGVPNPTAPETFCLCGLEMQMAGARITSLECPGFLDTIRNGSLYKKRSQLAKYIVRELRATDNDYSGIIDFINNNFSQETAVANWEKLLTDCIPNGTHLHPVLPMSNPRFRLKWLKESLRKLKSRLPLLSILPPIEPLCSLCDKINYKIYKIRNGFNNAL